MSTTETKCRPILFTGPMVRAVLDGTKSQTRRVIKPQPEVPPLLERVGEWRDYGNGRWRMYDDLGNTLPAYPELRCRWQAGDRLWVRETFRVCDVAGEPFKPADIAPTNAHCFYKANCEPGGAGPWRPSIFMPRWASRLTLEVLRVRVERVQEISEEDAKAEGCRPLPLPEHRVCGEVLPARIATARERFADLWDSINAKRGFGWDANPWLFAIDFRRVEESQ